MEDKITIIDAKTMTEEEYVAACMKYMGDSEVGARERWHMEHGNYHGDMIALEGKPED